MEKRICNYCNGEFERDEMMFTKDCHEDLYEQAKTLKMGF